MVNHFINENINFWIPKEIKDKFRSTVENPDAFKEQTNLPIPKLTAFLNEKLSGEEISDEQLKGELKNDENNLLKQVYYPDRYLNTPLHKLFAERKFQVLKEIKDDLENGKLKISEEEVVKQFDYIYEYHFEFDKNDLLRIYAEFDYLFDFEYENFDQPEIDLIAYFQKKLNEKIVPLILEKKYISLKNTV